MINSEKFSERLHKVIEFYSLSASAFADKVGVQRSSISHILSGRNKPSLDFVLKVIREFPEVELNWFLNGKGNFPYSSEIENKSTTASKPVDTSNTFNHSDKEIDRIVVFFKDGTFKNYLN